MAGWADSWKLNYVSNPSSPQTVSVNVGSAANRQMVVQILYLYSPNLSVVSGVSCGTDALSLISNSTASLINQMKCESWGGTLTVTGAQTVSITISNPGTGSLAAMIYYADGVDAVENGIAGSDIDGTPLSLAITTSSGITLSSIIHDGTGLATNQIFGQVDTSVTPIGSAVSYTGVSPVTHTWSTPNINWNHAVATGVSVHSPSSNPTPTTAASVLSGVLAIPSVGFRLTVPTP